ncbi:HAMP domain-containing sensor histidine kinase [Hydrogenivirga sp. 128-5-R1-1]|uniref:sensor histidine kinase n=1 Tax=Hydrogenivirga sp. 128-5-R1-1 TaxID=392423 RepID=UPI00015F17BE|nr:HAMP domain-containing sensor histidine kinase [Hydrogenivirga sp. 128-5-R1-1]EDP73712.1 sensor histidine kinase [Hydrogenivirga sp. 128-5-R1-1]
MVINKNLDQYHIYVGKDLKNILKDMYKLKAILFYSFFGLSSVLLVFSFYISKYILRPLKLSMKKQEEFIQNTSHDLKTPLTVISSNIQLMKHKNFQNIEKNIEITESNLGYMKKIVEDMLFLSSIGQKTKEKVDINKIISEIIQYFEEKIKEKKLNIEINLNGNLHIYANYEDIKRLFFNLIENAIKYNDENGKIIIQSKNKTIYIKNTGKLIKEEDRDKIFDRFYRADKSRSSEGTGLGLAIVNEIAKLYGIKIKVKIENNMNVFILKF